MHGSTPSDIRGKISDWLAGPPDIDQLKEWIVDVSWNIEEKGSVEEIEDAYGVVHSLALYDDDQDIDRLRSQLHLLATTSGHGVYLLKSHNPARNAGC